MNDWQERAAIESEEVAAIARKVGGRREYDPRLGIFVWRIPPYLCDYCVPLAGDDTLPLPGCPQPLARHGPIERH